MAGRTLLQQAVPVTFGLKAAGWLAGLDDARRWLEEIRLERLAAQLGGAAGTLASLGDAGPQVAAAYAELLGLVEPPMPWHTQRGRIGELASALAVLSGAVAKAARDIVLLSQTEVAEVREAKAKRCERAAERRVFADAAQAQPGRGDLRSGMRPAGARAGRDAARRDGARARARGGLVARGVASARRAAALDGVGRRLAAGVARGPRGRPGADARQPRADGRAADGRAGRGGARRGGDGRRRCRPTTSLPRSRSWWATSAPRSCSTLRATSARRASSSTGRSTTTTGRADGRRR